MKLETTFCGVTLKNPLIAGSCDNSRSFEQLIKIVESGIGGVVLKSLTDVVPLQNRNIARFLSLNAEGTPWKPGDTKGGFFSRGGSMLSQKDWEQNLCEIRPLAADHDVVLIGNICAARLENWKTYARIVEDSGLPLIELNLGNPHYGSVDEPIGARIAQMEDLLYNIIDSVSQVVSIPVIAKLSPQVSDIIRLTETCKNAGAAAVTISHRFQGFLVDIDSGRPVRDIYMVTADHGLFPSPWGTSTRSPHLSIYPSAVQGAFLAGRILFNSWQRVPRPYRSHPLSCWKARQWSVHASTASHHTLNSMAIPHSRTSSAPH